jgi:hypothetical protein
VEKTSDFKKLNLFFLNKNLAAIKSLTTWMIGLMLPHGKIMCTQTHPKIEEKKMNLISMYRTSHYFFFRFANATLG